MSKTFFFKTLLKASLLNRKSRVLVAIVSLVLGVSLASMLLNITFDVRERMGSQLRGYGANVLLVPKDTTLRVGLGELSFGAMSGEGFISESYLGAIESLESAEYLVGYTPYLYGVVDVNAQEVVLVGVWFDSLIKVNPSWKLDGEKIPDRQDMNSTVIGIDIAESLGLKVGDSVEISREGRAYRLSVAGLLSTGGSEDNQLFVSLSQAQEITGNSALIHTVQLSYAAGETELKAIAEELAKIIPSANAKVITQVAEAEKVFLGKISTVTTVLTVGVLAASAVAVMSTFSTIILERRNEIGLMLALGASSRRIAALFLAEVMVIGLVGGFVGYFLGVGLATAVWLRIFNTPIFPRLASFFVVVGIAVGVCITASLLPVRQALKVTPAVTLRGE